MYDTTKLKFELTGNELEIVHNFKYLGIILNYNGSIKLANEELENQASRAMYIVMEV